MSRGTFEWYSPTSDLFRVDPEGQFNGHFEIGIFDSNILTDEEKESVLANVFIDPDASEGLSSGWFLWEPMVLVLGHQNCGQLRSELFNLLCSQ